jgi:hypothetical protein
MDSTISTLIYFFIMMSAEHKFWKNKTGLCFFLRLETLIHKRKRYETSFDESDIHYNPGDLCE